MQTTIWWSHQNIQSVVEFEINLCPNMYPCMYVFTKYFLKLSVYFVSCLPALCT